MTIAIKKNHIVLDTNVFISSIIGQSGYSRKIFDELVLTGEARICLSEEVLQEYEEIVQRERFQKHKDFSTKAKELILSLKEIALWVEPTEKIHILSDEDDNKFIELAVEANAGYIVTGNTNDFTLKEFRGIKICTPKEYYDESISQIE